MDLMQKVVRIVKSSLHRFFFYFFANRRLSTNGQPWRRQVMACSVFAFIALHAVPARADSGWCGQFGSAYTYNIAMNICFNQMLPLSPDIVMGSCVPLNYGEYNGIPYATWGAWVISAERNPGNGQLYINDGVGNQWYCTLTSIVPNVAKANGKPQKCNCVADPINAGNGNVFRREEDFDGGRWLKFARFYNSSPSAVAGTLGQHWRHSFAEELHYQAAGSNPALVTITHEDGQVVTYVKNSSGWSGEVDVVDALSEQTDTNGNATGWTLQRVDTRSTEQFDASGHLLSSQDGEGFITTFTYSTSSTPTSTAPGPGYLVTVTDPQQRAIQFGYDASGRITGVTAPDGSFYGYAYNAQNDLQSVTFPDGKARTYLYNETPNSGGATTNGLLTGMLDESGNRYVSYSYNAAGQAINNQLAGGVASYTLTYNSDGSADVVDPLGTSRHHAFTTIQGVPYASSVSGICESCSSIGKWAYTFNGQLSQTTDYNGNVTTYQQDGDGMPAGQVEGFGSATPRMIQTAWNDTFHVPTEHRLYNASYQLVTKTDWLYNTRGQPLAQCDIDASVSAAASYVCVATGTVPAGVRRSTYTYCDAVGTGCPLVGLLLTSTGPRTDLTQTTFYSYYTTSSATSCGTPGAACYQAGDLYQVTDPLGHVTTITSYDADGRITRITDANGTPTDSTYTPRGWLATRSVGGSTTTFTYTPYGAVQTVTDPYGITTTYGYDAAHRLTSITDALGNVVQYTLDAAGDKTAEQTVNAMGTVTHSLSRGFNALGQLTGVTDGLNQPVFNASASGAYDANGNLLSSTDALGTPRQRGYDALNRLIQSIDNYNGTDPATQNTTTAVTYDSLDRTTQVTDPSSLNTTYRYDGLSNATGQTSPDTGTTNRTFDAAGNVLTRTDAKGITATLTYDALNRPLSVSYPDSTQNITYTYDEANGVTNCTNSYPTGRLTRIVENAVTTVYCYDPRGNVIQKQQITSTGTDTTGYSYTAANRLSGLVYPSGSTTTYSFDADGRIQSITLTPINGTASTAVSNVTYLPFGPVSSYTLGNGQTITRTYDANYRFTDITSPAFNLHVARDAMGNLTALGNAAGANPATETYTYDPLYRIQNVNEASGTALESYTYNKTGDRLSKTASITEPGTGAYGYTTNTHQLLSIGSTVRANDVNGNTTSSTNGANVLGFGYNDRNRLAVVQSNSTTVGTYTYNALGQRIGKVATTPTAVTERYDYDQGSQLLSEYGSTNRDYVWLGSLLVATVDNGTTPIISYVHVDGLGTPRAVTNSAGTVIWQWAYQGNPLGQQPPTSSTGFVLNLGFPGQYFDAESGLYYNMHRDYDSATGRYLQPDPLGQAAGPSLYLYVGANPLMRTDPFGLAWGYGFNVGFTVITPWVAVSGNIGAGFTLDGLNSVGFDQAQLNISDENDSHGLFVGAGPAAGVSDAAPPTTGLSSAPYLEGDGGGVLALGAAATKNECGKIDWSASHGPKGGFGAGLGGFSGTSYNATLVGPTLGTMLGYLGL